MAVSAARLSGESVEPSMSATRPERSRTVPFESTRPGFSAPGWPYLTSFMDCLYGL